MNWYALRRCVLLAARELLAKRDDRAVHADRRLLGQLAACGEASCWLGLR